MLHVATEFLEHLLILIQKMLGVPAWALPSWLRLYPQNRTTVMRASGSILLCQ